MGILEDLQRHDHSPPEVIGSIDRGSVLSLKGN